MKNKLLLLIVLLSIMSMAKGQNIGQYINARDSVGSVTTPTVPIDSELLLNHVGVGSSTSRKISIWRLQQLIGNSFVAGSGINFSGSFINLGGTLTENVSIIGGGYTFDVSGVSGFSLNGNSFPLSDGTNGQVLSTNGSGNWSFIDVTGGSVGGAGNLNVSDGSGGFSSSSFSVSGNDLIPDVTNTNDIGTGLIALARVYSNQFRSAGSNLTIAAPAGFDVYIASNGANSNLQLDATLFPTGSDFYNVGSASNRFEDGWIDDLVLETLNGLTFPTSDGTNGQVLTTDGSGTISFQTAGLGAGSGLTENSGNIDIGGTLNVNATISGTGELIHSRSSSGGGVLPVSTFDRTKTGGAATNGIGGQIVMGVHDENGITRDLNIRHILTDASASTSTSEFEIQGYRSGSPSNTIFRTGSLKGTVPVVDSDPDTNLTDAEEGSLAWDSTDDEFRVYDGSAWSSLGGGGENYLVINSGGTFPTASGTDGIALGELADASNTDMISIGRDAGNSTGIKGVQAISLGSEANSSGADNIGQASVVVGRQAKATNINGIALGNNAFSTNDNSFAVGLSSVASGVGSLAIGRSSNATAQGAIMMGYHTSAQTNSIGDSFELSWDGTTGFKAGNTIGTTITNNSNPDSNLTDATEGTIAWDTTDEEVRIYDGTSWEALAPSGSYAPTYTNSSNTPTITGSNIYYSRVGDLVTVSGLVNVTCTASATSSQFRMTLPITSALTGNSQANGTGALNDGASNISSVMIQADFTNDELLFIFQSVTTTSDVIRFVATYTVL